MDFLYFIRILFELFSILILLRIILSWYSPRSTNVLLVILYRVTDPLLVPLRRIIPRVGVVDFSPLAAIILLQLIYYLIAYLLS